MKTTINNKKLKISAQNISLENVRSDILVIGLFEGESPSRYRQLDQKLRGEISSAIKSKEFRGEFKQIFSISTFGIMNIKKVLLIGLGKENDFDKEKLRKLGGYISKSIRGLGYTSYATDLPNNLKIESDASAQAFSEGALLGLYKFSKFKSKISEKEKENELKKITIIGKNAHKANYGIQRAIIISEAVNYSRDLINMPGSILTATKLAEEAVKVGKANRIKIQVFGKNKIKKLGMGGLLGINRGSKEEPRFIVMDYKPSKIKDIIALVGKGITFDSGGLYIKTYPYMDNMQMDKAGACIIIGLIQAAAKLKLPYRIVGCIPSTDNMPGGDAVKPGDVVTAYNKKTIEIAHTDAEGRVILADGLSYAEKNFKPSAIIDLATLTGAAVAVTGYEAAPIIGNDDELVERIKFSGYETFERVWQLPLWEEFKDNVKSDIADVRNSSGAVAGPGTINGAVFLSNFVEETPWAHIDIAGVDIIPAEKDYIPKGGTAFGLRLILNMIENWKPLKKKKQKD